MEKVKKKISGKMLRQVSAEELVKATPRNQRKTGKAPRSSERRYLIHTAEEVSRGQLEAFLEPFRITIRYQYRTAGRYLLILPEDDEEGRLVKILEESDLITSVHQDGINELHSAISVQ